MRIIRKKEFIEMPEGTIYQPFINKSFGSLTIKGESVGDNDFMYMAIDFIVDASSSEVESEILDYAEESGEPFNVCFDVWARDGMFEPDLYAVWSNKEVRELIKTLGAWVK